MKITICKLSQLKVGDTRHFKFGLHQGILIRDEEGFHAFKNFCPHMGGATKKCDANTLQCCMHNAKFDIKTGKALPGGQAPEGTGLPLLDVHLTGDELWCEYTPPVDPFE